jgi:hypothetical protein
MTKTKKKKRLNENASEDLNFNKCCRNPDEKWEWQ